MSRSSTTSVTAKPACSIAAFIRDFGFAAATAGMKPFRGKSCVRNSSPTVTNTNHLMSMVRFIPSFTTPACETPSRPWVEQVMERAGAAASPAGPATTHEPGNAEGAALSETETPRRRAQVLEELNDAADTESDLNSCMPSRYS